MQATTISLVEGAGSLYPAPTPNDDDDIGDPFPGDGFAGDGFTEVFTELGASEGEAAFVQERIESYIKHRWGAREFEAIIEGPGEWVPPLVPVNVTGVEVWIAETWTTYEAVRTPLGYIFDDATYRVTGTAGNDEAVPPTVAEAARRLHAYYVDAEATQRSHKGELNREKKVGRLEVNGEISPNFVAKALIYSGAADLLRPFRKLGRN